MRLRGVLAGAAIVLVGLNLRPALAGVGPVLDDVRADLGLAPAAAGALTTLPTLCMAVCAPASMLLAGRVGIEPTVLAGLLLIALGTLARGLAPDAVVLVATVLAIGVGIGLAQTLVPAMIRSRFPRRAIVLTAVLGASLNLGAITASALAVPLTDAWDSWRPALGVWVAPAVLAALVWFAAMWPPAARAPAWSARGPVPWRLGLLAGVVSLSYFVVLAWLAPALEDAGSSASGAGLLLGLVSAAQIPVGLAVGALLDARSDVGRHLARWLCVNALGLTGVALAVPFSPLLWIVLLGGAMGALFALVLILPVRYATDASEVVWLSAAMFGIGYSIAAAGPFLVGALAQVSDGFALPFGVTAALLVAAVPMAHGLQTHLSSRAVVAGV